MKKSFLFIALLMLTIPGFALAYVTPAATVDFVSGPHAITPSQSPFTFEPLSDFKHMGVETTYRVEGVYPSEDVLYHLKYCESRVYDAYMAMPATHRSQLKHLTFLWYAGSQRGLGGDASINLKCNDLSDSELTSVFVHEMGHIVDTGVLGGHSAAGMSPYVDPRSAVFKDDPSIGFYAISWRTTNSVYRNSTAFDFVTLYAMSNPFEDFGETYNFYLLHGSQFKYMARTNKRLADKYAYMRAKVFGGKEFINNDFKLNAARRTYDATVLPFSLVTFLKRG